LSEMVAWLIILIPRSLFDAGHGLDRLPEFLKTGSWIVCVPPFSLPP